MAPNRYNPVLGKEFAILAKEKEYCYLTENDLKK